MSEFKLRPQSPLLGFAVPGRYGATDGTAGVTVREISNAQLATIIAKKSCEIEVASRLSKFVDANVVDHPRRAANGCHSVTGVSPSQWLVQARGSAPAALLSELSALLSDLAAIVDQSHSRFVIEVAGPRSRDALAKGIPVDLDPKTFNPGDAAHTSASHIGLQVALLDQAPTFEIISASSTAGSFWSWLASSSAEYGLNVLPPS